MILHPLQSTTSGFDERFPNESWESRNIRYRHVLLTLHSLTNDDVGSFGFEVELYNAILKGICIRNSLSDNHRLNATLI